MQRISPRLLVLAELELWPNLIWAAQAAERARGDRQRPAQRAKFSRLPAVSSAAGAAARQARSGGGRKRLSMPSGFWRSVRSRPWSRSPDRSSSTAPRPTARMPRPCGWRKLAGFGPGDVVFLAGSTQEPEEQLALETFRHCAERFPRLKLILVPRHPERFERVAQLLAESGLAWRRRSQLDAGLPDSDAQDSAGRSDWRIAGLVGDGRDRLCRRQPDGAWRTKHDRAGRLWRRRLLWPGNAQFSRRGGPVAGGRGGGGRPRRRRTDLVRHALPQPSRSTPRSWESVPGKSSRRSAARPAATMQLLAALIEPPPDSSAAAGPRHAA